MKNEVNDFILEMKGVKNLSNKTCLAYSYDINKFIEFVGNKYKHIKEQDFLDYISYLNLTLKLKDCSIKRKIVSIKQFYAFLYSKRIIKNNTIKLTVVKFKQKHRIPKILYIDEVKKLLDVMYLEANTSTSNYKKFESIRNIAILELLVCTGIRISEASTLCIKDISISEKTIVIHGKGNKERLVYFDARTKIHLQNYLDGRTDGNPALFVSLKAPFDRLMIGGVETRLRELGKRLNIPKVHPHKFRRTLATTAIDKGMPIEQVQQLLGHQKIDTTMHYAMVKQQNVKLAHRKYIG